jgi:DNA repair protein SbcD/Mre11
MDQSDAREMKLVHLSDIHLGYRQYQRQTPTGINQREADVATSLRRVIDKVIEVKPDVVLIAGDVFHAVRPPNPAILHAYLEFSRLVRELPGIPIVLIAGNHDTPLTSETGSILKLFATVGITVVEREAKRITLHEHDLSILAVPEMGNLPLLDPDPAAKYNVLLLHGEIEGVIPRYGERLDRAPMKISQRDLRAERWDYVALGHYHVYRSVAPNAFYSGSLDYTSTNPWGELAEERASGIRGGKGFIEQNLATRAHRFHSVPPLRRWEDLNPVSGAGMSASALDTAVRESVDACEGGLEDKIVRLVVSEVPRHILRELDHKAIREYKRRALHFHLDTRRPEILRPKAGQAAPGRRASLADTVRAKLETRQLTENIDRTALVELGLHYLREADSVAGRTLDEDAA